MKHYLIILFALLAITCKAQQKVENLSDQEDLKYVLASIINKQRDSLYDGAIIDRQRYSLYNSAFYATIYRMADSKATTEEDFEGSDEVFSSVLIVISPDSDYYYPGTKLFKISRLCSPEIISVKETKYPNFVVSIKRIRCEVKLGETTDEYVLNGDFYE